MAKEPPTASLDGAVSSDFNPLFRPSYLRGVLEAAGFSPQKSRGQNFLIDRNRGEAIVAAAALGPEDVVLEIGPGPGAMTREICRRAARVFAVEYDPVLAGILRDQTRDLVNLEIIEEDILALDLPLLVGRMRAAASPPGRLKVVANLPYSISGPLLARLLLSEAAFAVMVLMVQKEVGERIVSSPGGKRYGRLSVLARLYSFPRIVAAVSRNSFFPRPRVDSVVIRFQMKGPEELPAGRGEFLREVVRAAFSQRRKMLKNTLAATGGWGYSEARIINACASAGIDPRCRAEELSAADFIRLADGLKKEGFPDAGKKDRFL